MVYPGSGKPLFEQIRDSILEQITNGYLKQGDKLPGERDLAERFNVSRVTVRQALSSLVKDGILLKHQGKGNFVSEKKVQHDQNSLLGFYEEFKIRDTQVEIKLVNREYAQAPDYVCKAMNFAPGTSLRMIERIISLMDGRVVGVDQTYFPDNIAYLMESLDYSKDVVYSYLEKNGYKLSGADQYVSAEAASDTIAHRLEIPSGNPVLVINRTTFVEGDLPIIFSCTSYRSDHYNCFMRLKRYPYYANAESPQAKNPQVSADRVWK